MTSRTRQSGHITTQREIRNQQVLRKLLVTLVISTLGFITVGAMYDVTPQETAEKVEETPPIHCKYISVTNTPAPETPPAVEQKISKVEVYEAPLEEEPPVEPPTPTDEEILIQCMGNQEISLSTTILKRYATPDYFYSGIDYTTMQPFEDYRCITSKSSPAWKITRSENAYTDGNGLRRHKVTDGQFSIDGIDDYVVALGTYYKEKGTAGSRFLVVTSTGMYTIITGDEKADQHTDSKNMFSYHGGKAGVIEFIVDTKSLPKVVRQMGSVHYIDLEPLNGNIQMIYKIT